MQSKKLLDMTLQLFGDDAGAGASDSGSAGSEADYSSKAVKEVGKEALPQIGRRGKNTGGNEVNVLYGKQPDETGPDAGDKQEVQTAPVKTPEERKAEFERLIAGDYKEVFAERAQQIIDRRFKETKSLKERLASHEPVLDMLMTRYKVADGDVAKLESAIKEDTAYWEQLADDAGMSVETYKVFNRLERDNKQLRQAQELREREAYARQRNEEWAKQAAEAKEIYPSLDLQAEIANPQFFAMLRSGIPVQHAYEVAHISQIKTGIAQAAAQKTEKSVVDGIRAKGTRPTENGATGHQNGVIVKNDPSKFTKSDRAAIAARVARGEKIEL